MSKPLGAGTAAAFARFRALGYEIERNLQHLRGIGIGLDHNRFSVEYARGQGLQAFTPEGFERSEFHRPVRPTSAEFPGERAVAYRNRNLPSCAPTNHSWENWGPR